MKIVVLTDIHGAYDRAEAIVRREAPDAVIVGGDLTTVGSVDEARKAIVRLRTVCSSLWCVAGNMDLPAHDDLFLTMGVSINGRGVILDNVGICGASAAPHSMLHTPYEVAEEEIGRRLRSGYRDIQQAAVRICVPHAPPYGTKVDIIHSGLHVGSTAVREFIEEAKPHVVLCGHIHEGRGRDHLEGTQIINCGSAAHGYYASVTTDKDLRVESMHMPKA